MVFNGAKNGEGPVRVGRHLAWYHLDTAEKGTRYVVAVLRGESELYMLWYIYDDVGVSILEEFQRLVGPKGYWHDLM